MFDHYKIIISNKNLYKEIEISKDDEEVTIGTGTDCTVRLNKDLFLNAITLYVKKEGENFILSASDNLYLTKGDSKKILSRTLVHGDNLFVKYQDSDNEVFTISFFIDFDFETKDYDIAVSIANMNEVVIGGRQGSAFQLSDQFLGDDTLSLRKQGDDFYITDNDTKYGVLLNGSRLEKTEKLKNHDFFSITRFSFYYHNGFLFMSSKYNIKFFRLNANAVDIQSTHFKYPKFNRNTRVQYEIPEEKLEVQPPAQAPQKAARSAILTLMPPLTMLVMTVFLRGTMGGGGMFVLYSAGSMGVGALVSLISSIQDKRKYKRDYAKRIDQYNIYIRQKREEIEESRKNELRINDLIYESLEHDVDEALHFGRRLFEKSVHDKVFLQIYLGRGTIESSNQLQTKEDDFANLDDPLSKIPEELKKEYRYIQNGPIFADMNASNAVGVVGPDPLLFELMKNMTLDIVIRHFFKEVKLVYILDEKFVSHFRWLRFFRNVQSEHDDIRNIAADEDSVNSVLEELYMILTGREEETHNNNEKVFDENFIVFVTDAALIDRHPVSKYIKDARKYGFTFVFLENYEEFLPFGCGEIIRLEEPGKGILVNTMDGDHQVAFKYPAVNDATAEEIALKLGAVNVDEVSLESELTKNITMFQMMNIYSVEDIDLAKRWSEAETYKSLAAPIGVKKKNEIVYLDISDKAGAHGPHGLVAGTTGSGKSEVLQTYILSLCTLFHPYDVGFVIIDFKGGGMANQFKDLPHLIGTITNIDGREINRSLLSIKAELVKRQEMFSACGVNHIKDYQKLYKAGKVTTPMPHLIMIVDEFAELKQEYPDFMKELISAARIGRTLGVHLILATQKPAGVVDAQIWSNSKFKICLKVQTREDSSDVLKTPLAAEIVEPGRAYFQVGNNEIFELFQSAYSGAPVPEGGSGPEKIFKIYETDISGRKKLIYTNKKDKKNSSAKTELQAIVDYVHNYCEHQGIEKLPGICLPSLPDALLTDDLSYEPDTEHVVKVPLGIFDDPEQQRQGDVYLEISKENTFIVGSSQMGKTVMLSTIIYGLIRKYTSKQVNLYLIDCGSMVLKIFEGSHHVGGVVLSSETEKCKNLFKLLQKIIVDRKKILSSKGIGSFSAYLEAGNEDMPEVVVIIDNFAAFKEYFPDETEEISSIVREAQGVGLSFIITAQASNAMNYRVQANFGTKFILNCNDTNEYSNFFGHTKITPKEVPGRGLLMLEKRILEFQTALFGHSDKEAERSEEFKEFIGKRNLDCQDKAVKIPMIPDRLVLDEIMSEEKEMFRQKETLPVGMDFESVEYTMINLHMLSSLSLVGENESRDIFAGSFVKMMAKTAIFHNIEGYIIDDKSQKLKEYETAGFVKTYSGDAVDGFQAVCDFIEEVEKRLSSDEEGSMLVLVLNSLDVLRKISQEQAISKKLSDILKSAKEADVFLFITCVENAAVGFSGPEILKQLKAEQSGVYFGQLTDNKFYEFNGRVKPDPTLTNTCGYLISGSNRAKIKIFE